MRGQRERQQREARRGAHRRQVAQVDRERAMTDGRGRRERAIEVHAFDERVDAQHLEAIALRLDHRRIVADADQHPVGRRRQPCVNARDELALGEARDAGRGEAGASPAPASPHLA